MQMKNLSHMGIKQKGREKMSLRTPELRDQLILLPELLAEKVVLGSEKAKPSPFS